MVFGALLELFFDGFVSILGAIFSGFGSYFYKTFDKLFNMVCDVCWGYLLLLSYICSVGCVLSETLMAHQISDIHFLRFESLSLKARC